MHSSEYYVILDTLKLFNFESPETSDLQKIFTCCIAVLLPLMMKKLYFTPAGNALIPAIEEKKSEHKHIPLRQFFPQPKTFARRLELIQKKFPVFKVSEIFYCPISKRLMNKPVILVGEGNTYDEESILRWLQNHDISPMRGVRLREKKLDVNRALSDLLDETLMQKELEMGQCEYIKPRHTRSKSK